MSGRASVGRNGRARRKQGGERDGGPIGAAAAALPHEEMSALATDEADAVLCALTAACYDNQVRGLGRELPELWLPEDEFTMAGCEPDGAELVRQEGWIYFPKLDGGTDWWSPSSP